MVEALLALLIVGIIAAGAYYASLKFVELRHNRNVIADELQRATGHIEELETRIIMLEADRDMKSASAAVTGDNNTGWGNLRG